MKRLIAFIKFYFKTGVTEKRFARMYSQVCELDYHDTINFGWFSLQAYGNSVVITVHVPDPQFPEFRYSINESDLGVVKVSHERQHFLPPPANTPTPVWTAIYEFGGDFSTEWLGVFWKHFKLVYETLYVNDVFRIRQRQLLENSAQGVMY